MSTRRTRTASTVSPVLGIAFLVSQVGAHAALAFGERLKALRLTPPHAGILRLLGSSPGPTQRELCAVLGILPSRLVALLDELQDRRLVERRAAQGDRRSYNLHLTSAGRTALSAIARETAQLERDFFSGLSATDRRTLFTLLSRIAQRQGFTPGVHPAYRRLGHKGDA